MNNRTKCYAAVVATSNSVDWGFGKNSTDIGFLGLMVVSWGGNLEIFRVSIIDSRIVTMKFSWRTPANFDPPYRVRDFVTLILASFHGLAIDLADSLKKEMSSSPNETNCGINIR